jgi:proline iminopeptidase
VGIDQRGCGQSRPLATDALGELHRNTTQSLIEDIEAVRRQLDIERWLVSGVSWGTTLALAYALAHPDRVSELVLVAVTTTSREEVDWITEDVGRIFAKAWQRFEQASGRRDSERIVEAYARRLATGDMQDRLKAARAWNDWESTHVSLDPNWVPIDQRLTKNGAWRSRPSSPTTGRTTDFSGMEKKYSAAFPQSGIFPPFSFMVAAISAGRY